MFMEKETHIMKELNRLKKLKKLVIEEIHKSEQDGEVLDMTIVDLEEWLQEIDAEILKLAASNRKGDCMKNGN